MTVFGSSPLLDETSITVNFVLQTQYFICGKIRSACAVTVHIPISVDQDCHYHPNSTLNAFLIYSYNNTVHDSDVIGSYCFICMCDIAVV